LVYPDLLHQSRNKISRKMTIDKTIGPAEVDLVVDFETL